MFSAYSLTELLLIGHFVLNLFFAVRIIYSKRASSVALAWLVILFVLPYVGTLAYLLFGEPRLGVKRLRRKQEIRSFYEQFNQQFKEAFVFDKQRVEKRFLGLGALTYRRMGYGIGDGNKTRLFTTSEAILAAFVEDIERAQSSCLVMFYIVKATGRVEAVLEALEAAAKRGVRCQLMVDDVGSKRFINSPWAKRLQENGVALTRALPIGVLKMLFVRNDLRNHRKLLIVDHKIAYTGSYNLVDPRFFKQESGVGEWVDVMMRCEGAVAQWLASVFYVDWAVENDRNLRDTQTYLGRYLQELPVVGAVEESQGQALLQVIPSAPDQKGFIVYETIIAALYTALDSVVITTPYFVPDESLLMALVSAAKRGVRVVIVLPKAIDSWLVSYASRAYYQMLLEAGVELAMFSQGLLHSKTVVVDGRYALFGTVNMDMRSFYLNMEVSLAVYDEKTVAEIVKVQEGYLQGCEGVDLSLWQKRPIMSRFIERCVRLLSPLL